MAAAQESPECSARPGQEAGAPPSLPPSPPLDRELILAALMAYLPDRFYFKDLESRIVYGSKSFAECYNQGDYTGLVGKTDFDLFTEEHAQAAFRDEQEIIRTGRAKLGMEEKETWPDGRITWVHTSKAPMRDEAGRIIGTFGISTDITERKQAEAERRALEDQLQHLQRLEAVGRLAGGIAHDMNNVLAAVMSVASLLELRGGEVAKEAGMILRACLRGRDLVKGLMDFSRKEVQETETMDLNELVRQEARLLASTTLRRIDLKLELEPNLPMLTASGTALSTALMNLCVNALDAMPDGGALTLRTARRGDQHLLLAVEDTGTGMTPEVLSRAIEPFFTTKPQGKGTGLGLSRVYGAVQAHGGTLAIESQPGRGTRILVTLPLAPKDRAQPPAVPSQ
jgi:PAS domain S-box-containing protein